MYLAVRQENYHINLVTVLVHHKSVCSSVVSVPDWHVWEDSNPVRYSDLFSVSFTCTMQLMYSIVAIMHLLVR